MGGPRPDRTRTLQQTAGDAAAAYHAEHAVRAGRTSHEEEMKVLIDTVRLPAADEPADLSVRGSADPTFVLPAKLGPRVVVAGIAGLLVVVALFAYLDRGHAPPASVPTRTELSLAAAAAVVPAPPAPAPAPAVAPPPSVETTTMPPTAVATRPRGSTAQPKPAGDVGEFKTSF